MSNRSKYGATRSLSDPSAAHGQTRPAALFFAVVTLLWCFPAQCDAAAAAAAASAAPADLKAPSGQGLRCSAPSSQTRAASNGDLIEADTPSDGTRLFAASKPFTLVITTRAPQNDTLNWQIRDTWNVVRASGSFGVAAGTTSATLSCSSTVAGYFAVSASLERARGQLESRGTRPAGIATFGVLPDTAPALPPVRFPYDDLHRFGGQGDRKSVV